MMRVTTVAAAAIAALGLAAAAQASTPFDDAVTGTAGLLGYYTFTDASQANSVVNGYTGVLQNGATVGGAGPFSGAKSLVLNNGASGTAYATAGGANPLVGGIDQTGTILAWINLASLPSTQARGFSIAGESQFGNDFDLQINGDNKLSFYTDNSSATQYQLDSSAVGEWLFIAATFTSGVERSLYVNGALVSSSAPFGHSASTGGFYVGQSNVFGGRYFDGMISDVAVFNANLTGAQIGDIYDASFRTSSGAPEPAAWSLMILGLGGVGAAMRRRRVLTT